MPSKPTSSWRPTNGETEGHVDHRPVAGERLARVKAGRRQRHLDRDVVGDFPQHLGLAHHAFVIERDDLGRDRPLHHACDLPDHLEEVAAGPMDEARVGGDAIEQPRFGELANFGDFGGVGEEFHDDLREPRLWWMSRQ
jgi:hypothetical protein